MEYLFDIVDHEEDDPLEMFVVIATGDDVDVKELARAVESHPAPQAPNAKANPAISVENARSFFVVLMFPCP